MFPTQVAMPCHAQAHASLQHKSRCSGLRSHAESKLRLIPIYSAKDAVIINAADGLSVAAAAMKTLHHCLQIKFLGIHA